MTFWFYLGPFYFYFLLVVLGVEPMASSFEAYALPCSHQDQVFQQIYSWFHWAHGVESVMLLGCENRGAGLWGLRMAPHNTKGFSELPLRLSWARLHTSNPAGPSTCLLTVASRGQQDSTLAEGPPMGRVRRDLTSVWQNMFVSIFSCLCLPIKQIFRVFELN